MKERVKENVGFEKNNASQLVQSCSRVVRLYARILKSPRQTDSEDTASNDLLNESSGGLHLTFRSQSPGAVPP